jgi:hypothetical protein
MSYLVAGSWHFAAAMAFAAALGVIQKGDALGWLRHPEFVLPLILGSSALFFIPDQWAKKGLMKFLHYPLPDWDVLLLGPASHRNWLTHSPLLPLALVIATFQSPWSGQVEWLLARALSGLAVGIGSHLFWDCVSSRSHKIVVVPYGLAMRPALSRVYLLLGAAFSLGVAWHFSTPHRERRLALWRTYVASIRHAPVTLPR